MKKITSLFFLVSSFILFFGLKYYTLGSFNYHISEFFGYIFYWSVALLIISLIAMTLNNKKYKLWSSVTIFYVITSILIAYGTRDGGGGILSFDGEMITWILIGVYFFISIVYFLVQFPKRNLPPEPKNPNNLF